MQMMLPKMLYHDVDIYIFIYDSISTVIINVCNIIKIINVEQQSSIFCNSECLNIDKRKAIELYIL